MLFDVQDTAATLCSPHPGPGTTKGLVLKRRCSRSSDTMKTATWVRSARVRAQRTLSLDISSILFTRVAVGESWL